MNEQREGCKKKKKGRKNLEKGHTLMHGASTAAQ